MYPFSVSFFFVFKFIRISIEEALVVLHLVSYQREVDKGKLTAVASCDTLTFRA